MVKEHINVKFELLLWAIAVILCFISLFPNYIGLELSFWLYYTGIIIAVVVIWRVITKWARKNREKIHGRIFEMFFFVFLFLATYALSFILDRFQIRIMGATFVFAVIGAFYCGLLHYREGIFNKKYWMPKSKEEK